MTMTNVPELGEEEFEQKLSPIIKEFYEKKQYDLVIGIAVGVLTARPVTATIRSELLTCMSYMQVGKSADLQQLSQRLCDIFAITKEEVVVVSDTIKDILRHQVPANED